MTQKLLQNKKFVLPSVTVEEHWKTKQYIDNEVDPEEETRQTKTWLEYFEKNGSGLTMIQEKNELESLVLAGIPDRFRGLLWQVFSGSIYSLTSHPGYYQSLLKQNENELSETMEEIEKDVHRALPSHPQFQSKEGIDRLRRVLTAFSWRNKRIGYCQSMNIIAALFLLYMGEEESFWMLCTVVENIVPEYYNKSLLGSQVDQQILDLLVSKNLAELDQHLKKLALPLQIISLPWFMCLFYSYIPEKAALRILDCFLFLGPDALLRAGLALLFLNQDSILSCEDTSAIIQTLKHPPQTSTEVIHTAFTEFRNLPTNKINELRNKESYSTIKQIHAQRNRNKPEAPVTEVDDYFTPFKKHAKCIFPIIFCNFSSVLSI